MIEFAILIVLLLIVAFIGFNVLRNRKSGEEATLEKTMSFDPSKDVETIQNVSSINSPNKSCALATTLRVIGVINIFAALILSLVVSENFGWIYSIAVIVSGCLGGIFCYALAKCVEAADKYLKQHE